jgi:hypothetical protein
MTRRVMVYEIVLDESSQRERVPQGEAVFHGFGADYEEFENGPGNYTVAIIEWPNGAVQLVQTHLIQFIIPTDPRVLS